MKKASIVSIGNEVISGQTVDTNAAELARELFSIGIPVVSCYTVGDEIGAIVRAMNLASEDADLVLATGGLGPTDDDLTRQAFAQFLSVELQLQQDLLEKMQGFFASRDIQMPEKNRIQAYIPAGAKALANALGTAPGFVAKAKGRVLIALPGVPSEMRRMFAGSVLPELRESAAGQAVVVRKLRCFGAGESTIAQLLGDLMQRGRNPLINCTANQGVITLHVIVVAESKDKARRMAEADEKQLRDMLGELVFGTGEQTLAEVVGAELVRREKTLSVAESCTGGMLGGAITAVSGASRYFAGGWVTYSNSAKTSEIGVPAELIERHGAVSEEVARAMAQGAKSKAQTDYAIGITGIAGPTGATEQKPVGLVYICVDSDDRCEIKRCLFPHERDLVRIRAVQTALNMLRLEFEN